MAKSSNMGWWLLGGAVVVGGGIWWYNQPEAAASGVGALGGSRKKEIETEYRSYMQFTRLAKTAERANAVQVAYGQFVDSLTPKERDYLIAHTEEWAASGSIPVNNPRSHNYRYAIARPYRRA